MNYELRIIIFALLAVTLFVGTVPFDVSAQKGLIPCGTAANPTPCEPCHIFSLVQNIYNWLILPPPQGSAIVIAIAILMFAYGGFLMLIPGVGGEKSVAMYTKGKKVLTNTLIGIIVIFLAWLTIDTIIKALGGKMAAGPDREAEERSLYDITITGTEFGPWNRIDCRVNKK